MNTVIRNRKTPHAVVNTVFGTSGTDMVEAWCFEFGKPDDRTLKRWIPKSNCYVEKGLQDLPDYAFKDGDIRKYHVDVWNAKSTNLRRVGKFLTNWEYDEYLKKLDSNVDAAVDFLKNFE
jgi:hypothetical protein